MNFIRINGTEWWPGMAPTPSPGPRKSRFTLGASLNRREWRVHWEK